MRADLLDRLLATLTVHLHAFSICQIQQGWRLGFSPFEAITIHYVLTGTGSLRVGHGPWIPFAPHSIIIVPARQSHAVGEPVKVVGEALAEDHCTLHGDGLVSFAAGDGKADTLLVCGQISASYRGALGLFELFQAPVIETFSAESVLHRLFELMLDEVECPRLGTQAITEVLMKHCLVILLRQHLFSGTGTYRLLGTLQEPKLARAVLTILEQPGASYSVESLALLSGMSRAAFAERFSQVLNQAPMDFVQHVRLRVAARLLKTTDLPIKVIASTIGYASRSSFSRAFETIYGAAPTEFRSFGDQEEAQPEKIDTTD